jgi:cysteine desulfurase
MDDHIYLDNAATTKLDPIVYETMTKFYLEYYGNASASHKFGSFSKQAIDKARSIVASLINCKEREIFFTSGATESINSAIKGLVEEAGNGKKHIITSRAEHSAVLESIKYLQTKGVECTYLDVDDLGRIDIDVLDHSIKDNTILVALMLVNNEIGIIHPIKEITAKCHAKGVKVFTDATQAIGKIEVNASDLDVDMMSFSAHKFHGPIGIGGLFVKKSGEFRTNIPQFLHGGNQEKSFRSGTINTPGIVGLGKASELALELIDESYKKAQNLDDEIINFFSKINGIEFNGDIANKVPYITNIRLNGVDSDALIGKLTNISISKGSACSSSSIGPSHVLSAMGLTPKQSFSSIRISTSRFTNKEEIEIACKQIKASLEYLELLM